MMTPNPDPPAPGVAAAHEAALVARVAAGDRDAFESVYRSHKDVLYSIAAHILADRAGAEDVVHDVFVRFVAVAGRVRSEDSLRSWLVACALNRCRDELRKRGVRRAEIDVTSVRAVPSTPPGEATEHEEQMLLRAAVGELPIEQREVVVLRAFSGLSFPNIAALIAAPLETTHSRWRYALARLRRALVALEPTR
jgi:RNA polymerase sigma factor (sigma-70 family)